jgi:hypothetical protein
MAHLTSQMNSVLLRHMPPMASLQTTLAPMPPLGTSGPIFAPASTVTPTLATLMTPSPYYKSLLTDTAWAPWLPVGLQSDLERWKVPFVPWGRRSPHWAAPTHGCSLSVNWTSASANNFLPIANETHHHIALNQSRCPSSLMLHNNVYTPTFLNPMPSPTCFSWGFSSSCAGRICLHVEPRVMSLPRV